MFEKNDNEKAVIQVLLNHNKLVSNKNSLGKKWTE